MPMETKSSIKIVAENRKARHDYHIHETYEAGIALTGTEVKSLRAGRANLKDSYAHVENGEYVGLWRCPFVPEDYEVITLKKDGSGLLLNTGESTLWFRFEKIA